MKKTLTILSLPLIFLAASSSLGAELPNEVNREIKKLFPKAKTLVSTPCRIGDSKIESYGILINANGNAKNPLRAILAHKKISKWVVNEIGKEASNSKGFMKDITNGFWTAKGLAPYQIRCTSPSTDVDINTQANGEFSKEFTKIDATTLHLCYQADGVYNSWACFTFDNAVDNIRSSFVQINAD